MKTMLRFPSLVFALCFVGLLLSVKIGAFVRKRRRPLDREEREDFSVIQGATLTLLGLIIGFSFSMAISRYDQRKNYEEAEANAIGTEYLRANLLSAAQGVRVHELLQKFLDQRVAFYEIRAASRLEQINRETLQLQSELWSVVQSAAGGQPTPVVALVVSGMNDVFNAQGYAEAAWLNRIPVAAWSLMVILAVFGCLLIGNGAHRASTLLFLVLPLAISIAFFLIADLDSPRGGLIRVRPQSLNPVRVPERTLSYLHK
jgi:hypothetical protein